MSTKINQEGTRVWAIAKLMQGGTLTHTSYEPYDWVSYDEDKDELVNDGGLTMSFCDIEGFTFSDGWSLWKEPESGSYESDKESFAEMAFEIMTEHQEDIAPEKRIQVFTNVLLGNEGINASFVMDAVACQGNIKAFDIMSSGTEVFFIDNNKKVATGTIRGFRKSVLDHRTVFKTDCFKAGLQYIVQFTSSGACGFMEPIDLALSREELAKKITGDY